MVFLAVFFGGGIGSLSRYLLGKYINNYSNTLFPLGTFLVNIIGCFVIGFLFTTFEEIIVSREIRLILITGFLGGFTTFSSFGLETINLLKGNEISHAIMNVFFNIIIGLTFVILGMLLAALVIKKK